MMLQRHYERLAFETGRGEYLCPIQTAADFVQRRRTTRAAAVQLSARRNFGGFDRAGAAAGDRGAPRRLADVRSSLARAIPPQRDAWSVPRRAAVRRFASTAIGRPWKARRRAACIRLEKAPAMPEASSARRSTVCVRPRPLSGVTYRSSRSVDPCRVDDLDAVDDFVNTRDSGDNRFG